MKKQFLDAFKRLTYSHHSWQVWSDFIEMAACAISNCVDTVNYEKREASYMALLQRYSAKEQALFPQLLAITIAALDRDPEQDFLGQLFMALGLGSHWRGQFFTPYHLCRLMADLNTGDLEENVKNKGHVSVNDCACGAGALLIAYANAAKARGVNYQRHVLFVAQDIDQTAAQMCYIQLALLGCPGYVVIGDTLRSPFTTRLEGQDVWYTPMYFSEVWSWRRTFQFLERGLNA